MTEPMTFSVIVPTFNRADMLEDTLRSIVEQAWPGDDMEILVVNNASTDETPDVVAAVQAAYPDASLRLLDERRPGLSFGRNTGVLAAQGRVVVLTDDDVRWDPGVLAALEPAFDDAGVVGATGCTLPEFEGPEPSWLRWLWLDESMGRCCGTYSLIQGDLDCDIAPEWMFGVHLALRREAVIQAGGFPSDSAPAAFQRWQGDGETGLCQKLAATGGRFRFVAASRIIHRIPASRLSIEFVQRRMFFQGIVNSYHQYRVSEETEPEGPDAGVSLGTGMGNPLVTLCHLILRDRKRLAEIARYRCRRLHSHVKWLQGRLSARRRFLRQLLAWEREGFDFHQREVAGDPDLLAWVRRESYLDADYPREAYASRDVTRSY